MVIADPPTLLMTMRTVASIWRYELQGQNAQDIAVCWDLCDKVSAGLSDLNEVAEKIAVALAAHGQAIKRFATGRGNTLSIGDRISNLGVKTKKPMPAMLVGGVSLAPLSEEFDETVPAQTDLDL